MKTWQWVFVIILGWFALALFFLSLWYLIRGGRGSDENEYEDEYMAALNQKINEMDREKEFRSPRDDA